MSAPHPSAHLLPTFRVVRSTVTMVVALEAVQRACFPTLAANERITAAHYRSHLEVFPEGQFAVLNDADEVVACSTDLRAKVDLTHYQHHYMDAVGNNWLTSHDPEGNWLYGADIGVKPGYRGLGISKLLYDARRELIRRLNLEGHVVGGLLSGYGRVKQFMSAESYLNKVVQGDVFDPTVSVQLRRGFRVHGLIHNYVEDPGCDNKAAFLVWHNPDYH